MSATLHHARWVMPIVSPPVENGGVLIDDTGMIRAVGRHRDLRGSATREQDHGEAVILPGLVNAHTHLELSGLSGQCAPSLVSDDPELRFTAWLLSVSAAKDEQTPAQLEQAAGVGAAECLATGTVLVGDVTNSGRSVPALVTSGLRARVFHELIGFDPRHAGTVFAAARTRVHEHEARHPGAAVRHALAAHAPYSVSSRLLRLIRGFNTADGRPSSIHLAESPAEDRFFLTGTGPIAVMKERMGTGVSGWEAPGQPSIAYLRRVGWFEAPGLAVHCTQLKTRGIELLRRAGTTVCLCPRSNEALGVGVAPARELSAAGVPLALGTDSLASVETLNLFDELEAAARLYDGVERPTLLRAATLGGARALGFGEELGSLETGKGDAVIAVRSDRPLGPDPYEFLFSGSPSSFSMDSALIGSLSRTPEVS